MEGGIAEGGVGELLTLSGFCVRRDTQILIWRAPRPTLTSSDTSSKMSIVMGAYGVRR